MRPHFLLLIITFMYVSVDAQLIDDFSDGDFSNNPIWTGQDSLFFVNSSFELQLNDTGNVANEAYLVTNTGVLNINDSITWDFRIKLLFNNPSNSNQPRFYLMSNSDDLLSSLDGYYIAIGETGANDKIKLYRQDGTSTTEICSGLNVFSNDINVKIRVIRDIAGNWLIESDTTLSVNNYVYEASGLDTTYTSSTYSGIYCKYTSTRSTKYIFDNISLNGSVIVDTVPPLVSSATILCPNTLELKFSEPVTSSADSSSNYMLIGSNISPLIVAYNNTYQLHFSDNFNGGDTLALKLTNIEDLANNILDDTIYIAVDDTIGNIIISENFCDGDFTSNPFWSGTDSLFIINNANEVQLNDTANIASDEAYLVTNTGLLDFTDSLQWNFRISLLFNNPSSGNQPRFYLVSDNETLSNALNGYFISIGETGTNDKIKLYRQDGTSTTEICSGLNVFSNDINVKIRVTRDIAGNWLIESDTSLTANNFIYEGGVNDNNHVFSMYSGIYCKYTGSYSQDYLFDDIYITGNIVNDITAPLVQDVFVTGNNLLEIQYSEPITANSAEDITNYYLNFGNGNPLLINGTLMGYELMFNNSFYANDTLELSINNIEDFSGNILDTTIEIIVPDTALKGEILFNELLFDPYAGGSDYVEFFNASNSNIDLYHYFVADYDASDGEIGNYKQITGHHVISPLDIVCFTEDTSSTISDFYTHNLSKIYQIDLPSFPNDSATIYLLTPDSIVVDKFSYSEDMHYELINDPEGISLEKIISNGSSNDFSNWTSAAESVGWGTPGVDNSQRFNQLISANQFEVQTAFFSPDNDGFEDVAVFSYQLTDSDMVGNASIYDKTGRLIKRVLTNKLLGTEGQFIWDGTNSNNQKAGIGIYLVHFEAFGENGNIITHKKSITLKTRF